MNRMSRRAFALLAGIAMIAPAAHGQIACKDIETLTEAAAASFTAIIGPPLAGDTDLKPHATRFVLAGATSCVIEQPFEETYRCEWRYATEADLMRAYESHAAVITPCLAGWEAKALLVGQVSPAGRRMLAGVGYLGNEAFASEVWTIAAERNADNDEAGYTLSIQVTHF
jgi:hypothetical protein